MKESTIRPVDKAQAREFRDRWLAVEEIQRREARGASMELRWRQLNAAYAMGRELRLSAERSEETQVRQRWAKLKEKASPFPKA